jgi:transcriptional regulator GlxA family with amidase domain
VTQRAKPIVALIAAAESSPSALYGLYDVLSSAGATYDDMVFGRPGSALLDVRIVATERTPFRCVGNVMVEPHNSLAEIDAVDVAVVSDFYIPIDVPPKGRFARETAWLRNVHTHGALIASVCAGSLVLAEAGLLDGRQCAGHWSYRDLFREHYPRVRFNPHSVLNLESEEEGVVTAGSATSWQDLALHLIGRFCGPRHAIQTAKIYLLGGHEDGQLPFAVMTGLIQKNDAVIAAAQTWIAENYRSATPVSAMAERSGLRLRTFARRFREATGYLPMEYVHALRIEEAKQIIETEPGNLAEVGQRVGYEDATFFRRLFRRKAGLTPAAYRRKFVGIAEGKAVPSPRRLR